MRERRDQYRRYPKEHNTREQGIERSEQLRFRVRHRIHRPHASEDHGGIQQSIDPGQPGHIMIAHDADAQTGRQNDHRERDMPEHSLYERSPAQESVRPMFVHT